MAAGHRFLTIILFTFAVYSCKNKNTTYVNYEKWKLPGEPDGAFLRGKPKKVEVDNEYDEAFTDGSPKENKAIYRFDNDGNVVYWLISVDSMVRAEYVCHYDENGEQFTLCSGNSAQSPGTCQGQTTQKSKRLNDGSYLVTVTSTDRWPYKKIYVYEKDKVTIKRYNDDSLAHTTIQYYENGRIIKSETSYHGTPPIVTYYHRNGRGLLDSITDNSLFETIIFNYNQQGDPVSEVNLRNARTETVRYDYEYDSLDNWIKRVKTEADGSREHQFTERRIITYNE